LKELFFRLSVNAAEHREFPALFHRFALLVGLNRLFLCARACPGRCAWKEGRYCRCTAFPTDRTDFFCGDFL